MNKNNTGRSQGPMRVIKELTRDMNTINRLLALVAVVTTLFVVTGCNTVSIASNTAPPPPPTSNGDGLNPTTLQWPRNYSTNGDDFAVYQPQISSWPGNQLSGRFVVAVRPTGTTNETYGVVFFDARTDVDKVNRLVTLEDFQIHRVNFPAHPTMENQYRASLISFLGTAVKVIPLDHLEAILSASTEAVKTKAEAVQNSPPKIFYATEPTMLVLVDGQPALKDFQGNFQRVINTRAILLFDTEFKNYYLSADNQWFTAPGLDGPWPVATWLPPGIDSARSEALATKEVDPFMPKDPNTPAPTKIIVSTTPAELLQVSGSPNMLSIPGTSLLYVQNTGNAIFYDINNNGYYVLISGRWFTAANLHGTWAFVPPGTLPGDFKKIPPGSEKSNVLLSVAGTPEAQEAVIANSIPQTASIDRDQAKLNVAYYDAPSFVPIAGTSLSYAANSQTPVIMVSPDNYYACQGGVWFMSVSPQGPWTVATSVPPAIYGIPVTCPIHYVTYSYIYGYTPSIVYAGYTPGYMGTVVAPGGVVVYGTGYDYPPAIWGAAWVPYPLTYGFGASFAMGAAVGFSFGFCADAAWGCEPYWGAYHWAGAFGLSYAHVNVNAANFYTHWGTAVHATGFHGYNAFTGREWTGHSASTFNPYTGAHGVGGHGAAFNPYTGNAAAARGGSWYNPSTGRYASGHQTVSGNAYNGNTYRSSSGTVGNTHTGNSASWANGSMSADRDGNVYHYNQSSGLQKMNSSGGWDSVNRSDNSFANDFDRQRSGQSLGSQRFDGWSRSGGGGWGGSRGGGGFGGFHGGGGGFHR